MAETSHKNDWLRHVQRLLPKRPFARRHVANPASSAVDQQELSTCLLEAGTVDPKQLAEARSMQARCGVPLEDALVSLGHATEDSVWMAVASVVGQRFVDLRSIELDPSCARLVSFESAHRHRLLPLHFDGDRYVIASPRARHDLNALPDPVTGWATCFVLVTPSAFDEALDRLHAKELVERAQSELLLLSPQDSARWVLDSRQKRVLCGLLALTLVSLAAAPLATISLLVFIATAFYLGFAGFRCWLV